MKPVTLVVGAGGTGKSALVHALDDEFKRLGLGELLVTAYTGVAVESVGGPRPAPPYPAPPRSTPPRPALPRPAPAELLVTAY